MDGDDHLCAGSLSIKLKTSTAHWWRKASHHLPGCDGEGRSFQKAA
jgi:hypothetical protein